MKCYTCGLVSPASVCVNPWCPDCVVPSAVDSRPSGALPARTPLDELTDRVARIEAAVDDLRQAILTRLGR